MSNSRKLRVLPPRGTGIITQAPSPKAARSRLENSDQPGAHVWVMVGAWRIPDPAAITSLQTFTLDHENMINLSGPGCFKCEQEYTPALAAAPCSGDIDASPEI